MSETLPGTWPAAFEADMRLRMVAACRAMNAGGLNHGTSGNLSVRLDARHCLITPSGVAYDAMEPTDIAILAEDGRWRGPLRPSSEWRFHADIMRARPDAGAILHTHSRHATALACLGEGIPAFHYMVAVAGGSSIRCAPYARFGTKALSELALVALSDRKACLLVHHGMIVIAATPEKALTLAREVDELAAVYLLARAAGTPKTLDEDEMAGVLALFASYGTPHFPDHELQSLDEAQPGKMEASPG